MNFNDVETARKTYYQKTRKYRIILGVFIAVIIALIALSSVDPASFIAFFFIPFSIFAFALVFFFCVISARKNAIPYHRAYKAYFVEQNLRATFSDLYYSHDQGLSREILQSTGMINTGDCYSSNDFTSGKYRDVTFSQADVHIQVEHTDSDGGTSYVTIFKGRFMIFEFPKKFNFKLELIGKRFGAYRIPGKNPTTGRKMQKISTESTEFNKTFKIYGEDGFEAYYILDPAFMVKIQAIAELHKGKIFLGFVDNRLIIGLNDGKDSFEPPKASRPIDEAAEHQKIASDIKTITDFVDQLSLSRKLFK